MRQTVALARACAVLLILFVTTKSFSQGTFEIPSVLFFNDSNQREAPTIEKILANYKNLMNNPDTALTKDKKKASRWMAHVMPYLTTNSSGELSKEAFTNGMKGIFNSTLNCDGNDDAAWISDGPINMPNFVCCGATQRMGGRVIATHVNPNNHQEILIGAALSGILKTTNGGQNWYPVTDDENFPVLDVKQIISDPNNSDRILAITGYSQIEGGLMYSTDAGESWTAAPSSLPEFQWLSYHPTQSDLVFACSDEQIYYSEDDGITWNTVPLPVHPSFFEYDAGGNVTGPSYGTYYKILALENRLIALMDYDYTHGAYIHEFTFNPSSLPSGFASNWLDDADVLDQSISDMSSIDFVDISNLGLGRFYIITKAISSGTNDVVLESTDQGISYSIRAGGFDGSPNIDRSTLVASLNDPNVYYHGNIDQVRRYNDLTGFELEIVEADASNGYTDEDNGHHDDFRSFAIVDDGSSDRIIFGNDGAVGLVEDGLAITPAMKSLNGDLSINMIHGFNLHEETGRVAFAFQDHDMIFRDSDGTYSDPFLFECGFAMIHQIYPNAIVGAWVSTIQDKDNSSYPIVSPNITGFSMSGYQQHYRHDPDRFVVGLSGGYVGMNEEKNVSVTKPVEDAQGNGIFTDIPVLQDDGSIELENRDVGDVAVCQRNVNVLYAARSEKVGTGNGTESVFAKSTDNGDSWIDLSFNPVTLSGGAQTTLSQIASYSFLRAVEVDHFNPDLLYVGSGRMRTSGSTLVEEERMVFRSTDGGATFTDWSEGLPGFPIERLLAVESDNYLLFCATSVGVYYRSDDVQQWTCFSKGLPKVEITGMQYDYCNDMLYVSTYGRGLYKTPVSGLFTNSYEIVIDQNETWDANRTIHADITVEDGATLTITGIIRLATDVDIRIEQGGELILDGGTLTNACGDMWQGIQVYGTTTASQNSSNCGTLRTRNGATIANAREAIRNWDASNQDWSSLGGIIYCDDTDFINNKRNAEFLAYNSIGGHNTNYRAHFNLCHFEFNDDHHLEAVEANSHTAVTMWGVKGVRFRGCSFDNQLNVSQSEQRKSAIGTMDAFFSIGSYCSTTPPIGGSCPTQNLTRSEIKGYHYGVEARGAFGAVTAKVKDVIFDENMVGVYLSVANNAEVVGNEFTVGNHPYFMGSQGIDLAIHNTAVLTEYLSDFNIEENEVTGVNTVAQFTHGVVVQEGGGAPVAIYKNEFNNLGSGAIGAGINADDGGQGEYGLRFICNENSGNSTDMEVRPLTSQVQYGYIDDTQSGTLTVTQSSGNILSAPDGFNSNFVHMDFESDKLYSFWHENNALEIPDPNEINIVPSFPDGDITTLPGQYQNTCASNYDSGQTKYDYYTVRSEYYNLHFVYTQLIDQGNTEGTLNDVVMSWSSNAWTLRDQLVARSPNNSESVLIQTIDQNVLPHGMLVEVLLLNPDALRSGRVIAHLNCCMINPLPAYMMDIVQAARNQQTSRTIMEHNLSNLRHRMANTNRLLVNEMLSDSLGTPADTLVAYLDDLRYLEGRYSLVSYYLGVSDFTNAEAFLDSIDIQIRPKGAKLNELNEMRNYVDFLETLDGQGRNVAQLNPTEIGSLQAIANAKDAGTAGARAKNVLCFFYDICTPPPSSPKSNQVAERKPKPVLENLIKDANMVTISPNPADQFIQFGYQLLFEKEDTEMRVYDQLGRLVKTYAIGLNTNGIEVLDTRKYGQGVYIVEIVQEGKQVFSDKFIVQH